MEKPKIGYISWHDLTVDDAETVSDFYSQVVGWSRQAFDMKGYNDYVMNAPDGNPAGGVCHARGGNADLPPQWLMYITVEDLDKSIAKCIELGGKIIGGKRKMGEQGEYCLVQDPAGSHVMLCS